MAKKSTRRRARRPELRVTNRHDPRVLTSIWHQLDRKNREQLMTAAFGMLRAQFAGTDVLRLPRQLQKVLLSSHVLEPFTKVMLCGPNKSLDFAISIRELPIGHRRRMRWLRNGNLIAPDWRVARS